MIKLSLRETGALLGTIDDADLRVLVEQLEEEHEGDNDYYICLETIAVLEDGGASSRLVKMLTDAVGSSEGVEVAWTKV